LDWSVIEFLELPHPGIEDDATQRERVRRAWRSSKL
jgi:hypothetical protein